MRAVDNRGLQVQLAGDPQLIEQNLLQLRPHAGFGPVPQPPSAGHPGAAELRGGNLTPGPAGNEDVDDTGQSGAVIPRQPPWWRKRRGGRCGSNGCTRCHSPSGTSSATFSSTTSSAMFTKLGRVQPTRNS